MKPSVWLATLLLPGLLLAGCRKQPHPAWLTPVRTVAPQAAVLPTAAPLPSAASPTAGTPPTTPLPTPPPLPFSPLKDGAYMYLPMKHINLWGRWAGYYRLPQAPNILIFVRGDSLYEDTSASQHTLDLSFAFQVFGIAPSQIATLFPPLGPEGTLPLPTRFIRSLKQIDLPDKEVLITPQVRRNISLYADSNGPLSFRTPVPNVFVTVESITISLDENPLQGGALWDGKETINCIVELEMAPGFHLKAPLRLWVPIAYYNGPPP